MSTEQAPCPVHPDRPWGYREKHGNCDICVARYRAWIEARDKVKYGNRTSPEDHPDMVRMHRQGHTNVEIGNRYGCSPNTVGLILRRYKDMSIDGVTEAAFIKARADRAAAAARARKASERASRDERAAIRMAEREALIEMERRLAAIAARSRRPMYDDGEDFPLPAD